MFLWCVGYTLVLLRTRTFPSECPAIQTTFYLPYMARQYILSHKVLAAEVVLPTMP